MARGELRTADLLDLDDHHRPEAIQASNAPPRIVRRSDRSNDEIAIAAVCVEVRLTDHDSGWVARGAIWLETIHRFDREQSADEADRDAER